MFDGVLMIGRSMLVNNHMKLVKSLKRSEAEHAFSIETVMEMQKQYGTLVKRILTVSLKLKRLNSATKRAFMSRCYYFQNSNVNGHDVMIVEMNEICQTSSSSMQAIGSFS